jgi:hypothetical protein
LGTINTLAIVNSGQSGTNPNGILSTTTNATASTISHLTIQSNLASSGAGIRVTSGAFAANITNSIISGDNDTGIINNGSGTINFSGALATGSEGGSAEQLAATTSGSGTINVTSTINAAPAYVSTSTALPLSSSFLDVFNGRTAPDGYAGAGTGGSNLSGYGDFVLGYLGGTTFPQTATVNGVTITTTAGTTPFSWDIVQVNSDPGALSAPNFALPVPHDTKYWTISPSGGSPTADLTMSWADGLFGDDTLAQVFHLDIGDKWASLQSMGATLASVVTAGNPNTITYTGVTNFSPFAIADTTTTPVELDMFQID